MGFSSLACFAIALVLWLVTIPFDRDRRLNHLFSCAWAALYAYAYPGWRVRVMGRQHIRPGVPYVIVANHTSLADIVLCFLLFRQFKWVSKASVFRVPLIGWNMRLCRYIPLVRGRKTSIAKMMEQARYWLSRGISVVLFPEGTRSADGRLGTFKHGAFTLAKEADVAVVPVTIHGGALVMAKHNKGFVTGMSLLVEVSEPMHPRDHADLEDFVEAVRNRIAASLAAPCSRGDESGPDAGRDAAVSAGGAEPRLRGDDQ